MNVLLTCAGRRSYLVQFFREALCGRGEVIACDCCDNAPALADADRSFVVPRVDAPDYADTLLAVCRENAVRLVIGVNDLELADLARQAPRFRAAGTVVVVAPPRVIATCQDKWATYRLLRSLDVPTPKTYPSIDEAHRALARGEIRFPLVIKPRRGTSSIGVERVENRRELGLAWEWVRIQVRRSILAGVNGTDPDDGFIIQEWLAGQEYGIDVVNDLQGRYACTLGRRKLAMRAGNTDRAETVSDPTLERLGAGLGHRLKHPGSLDADVLATDRGYLVLDLNPRFGGGYPFSHLAGANIPAALIAWVNGEEPDPSWLRARPGVVVSKYDGLAVIGAETARAPRARVRTQRALAGQLSAPVPREARQIATVTALVRARGGVRCVPGR